MKWKKGSCEGQSYERVLTARAKAAGPSDATWRPGSALHLCIVEPRAHPLLPSVLRRAAELYGGDGDAAFTLVTSQGGLDSVTEVIKLWSGHSVLFTEDLCGKDNLSVEDYSALLTSAAFWRLFPPDCHVLVFQTDVLLLRRVPDEYLFFDYVGAPWPWVPPGTSYGMGGNGGYSLRFVGAMLRAVEAVARAPLEPEDVFFARAASMGVVRCPGPEVASRFSVEHLEPSDGEVPTGGHQVWRFWDADTVDRLVDYAVPRGYRGRPRVTFQIPDPE